MWIACFPSFSSHKKSNLFKIHTDFSSSFLWAHSFLTLSLPASSLSYITKMFSKRLWVENQFSLRWKSLVQIMLWEELVLKGIWIAFHSFLCAFGTPDRVRRATHSVHVTVGGGRLWWRTCFNRKWSTSRSSTFSRMPSCYNAARISQFQAASCRFWQLMNEWLFLHEWVDKLRESHEVHWFLCSS